MVGIGWRLCSSWAEGAEKINIEKARESLFSCLERARPSGAGTQLSPRCGFVISFPRAYARGYILGNASRRACKLDLQAHALFWGIWYHPALNANGRH